MLKSMEIRSRIMSVGTVAVIVALSIWAISTFALTPADVKQIIISHGSLGPLVYIGLYVLTVVVSPLTGAPLVVASLAIFGYSRTLLYTYISNLIGASISFFIARKFGRPVIIKLIGKRDMKKVDEITEMIGVQTLIIFRLTGGGSFDFVSYAAGFTCIGFPIYFLITASCLIPGSLVSYYLLKKVMRLQVFPSTLAFVLLCIQVVLVPAFVYRYQKRKMKPKPIESQDEPSLDCK